MNREKLSDQDRMSRALRYADQLAEDLYILGYLPQAQLVREMHGGLYQARLNRAVADLARR